MRVFVKFLKFKLNWGFSVIEMNREELDSEIDRLLPDCTGAQISHINGKIIIHFQVDDETNIFSYIFNRVDNCWHRNQKIFSFGAKKEDFHNALNKALDLTKNNFSQRYVVAADDSAPEKLANEEWSAWNSKIFGLVPIIRKVGFSDSFSDSFYKGGKNKIDINLEELFRERQSDGESENIEIGPQLVCVKHIVQGDICSEHSVRQVGKFDYIPLPTCKEILTSSSFTSELDIIILGVAIGARIIKGK